VHLSCHERGWVFSSGPAGYSNWPIYVLAVVGPAGFVPSQDAFQQGTFLAPVQAIMTSADPVISIALGIAWLNVRLRSSPADIGDPADDHRDRHHRQLCALGRRTRMGLPSAWYSGWQPRGIGRAFSWQRRAARSGAVAA
jgi:hypothetical protein